MNRILEDHFQTVDLENTRTAHPPELIFLCGGSKKDERSYFRPALSKSLNEKKHNVVLAEDAMNWKGGQSFGKDLLELEKYYASLVSIIPIVCESIGAAAELGAFVNDEGIIDKLFIIIQEKYYSGNESDSFIRHGPIKHLEDMAENRVFCINDNDPNINLDQVCEEITSCKPKTTKCDFHKSYHRILLLIDIINTLSVAHTREITDSLKSILTIDYNHAEHKSELSEMLFVLETLKLVKKRTIGTKTFYLPKNNNIYLAYKYKNPDDYENISMAKKRILHDIYTNKTELNKIKANILKEERKIGHIKWLHSKHIQTDINKESLLKTAPLHYKIYFIPKKKSGRRQIAQPTAELKMLQREEITKLTRTLPIHQSATAYIKGKNGILENANIHKNRKYFYKFDFKNFFSSIKAQDFNRLLEKFKFPLSERIDLLKAFFFFNKEVGKNKTRAIYRRLLNPDFNINTNPSLLKLITEDYRDDFQLSIGAPSSPFISNAIMYQFDELLYNWASNNNLSYSRYADDITLSSTTKLDINTVKNSIEEILQKIDWPTLQLNTKKTRFCSFKNKVTITGLNITPEHKISIGRDRKKEIRAMIHRYTLNKLHKNKIDHLQGWLAYCKEVDCEFYESMKKKYTEKTITDIMRRSCK